MMRSAAKGANLPHDIGFALLIFFALSGLAFFGGAADLRAVAGFYGFFMLPGLLLIRPVLGRERLHLFEWIPLSIALSMAVWAVPGLVAYILEFSLDKVFAMEAALLAAALLFSYWTGRKTRGVEDGPTGQPLLGLLRHAPLALGLMVFALAFWFGSFRAGQVDWDYFNYISGVRKLLVWDKASLAHFAYRDAPPDPIHSYNVWALQWALIAKYCHVDPITLYLRAGIVTIPAAAFAFFALARKAAGNAAGLAAFMLFLAYQVIYGGMTFLGVTTFFPDDSQWMIVFPSCVFLLSVLLERADRPLASNRRLIAGLAFAVLAMSATHVLWGLGFYILGAGLLAVKLANFSGAGRRLAVLARSNRKVFIAIFVWAAVPYFFSIADAIWRMQSAETKGFTPLFAEPLFNPSPALILVLFLLGPAVAAAFAIRKIPPVPDNSRQDDRRVLFLLLILFAVCGAVASPYAWLRFEAIRHTAWEQFGRNPYRCFITPTLFYLNPFSLSLKDPNHTFYPMWVLGYLALPALWRQRREQPGALLALTALLLVPLIVFHPAAAALFTKYFSMGYLRRLLRLAAPFSFIPLAILLESGGARIIKRPGIRFAAITAISIVLSIIFIQVKAEPFFFNHILEKRIAVERGYPSNSLIFPDEPFSAIAREGWFEDNDIIFSDVWTSYRLTAYLPQFIAVQAKPGTGVADQDERRLLEDEFFQAMTTPERMREIVDHFQAAGVIVNVNPNYRLYDIQRGRPEAAAKLKSGPAHFELLYEQGDWVIFRRTQAD